MSQNIFKWNFENRQIKFYKRPNRLILKLIHLRNETLFVEISNEIRKIVVLTIHVTS